MSLSPASLGHLFCRAGNGALFDLPLETLDDLDAVSSSVEYPNGATLIAQGDSPRFVRILCSGRAKISTASQDGRVFLLNIANAVTILGLVAVIMRTNYETTARACGPCLVYEIANHDFLDYLFRHRDASRQVMQMLAAEHHELLVNARRVALSGTVAGNIAKLLLDWETTITGSRGKKYFNMMLTHQEIAEMVGTTRETVTRTLASFRQHGWIRVQGATVEILQQEKMKGISI